MYYYTWESGEYPLCPICGRSRPFFKGGNPFSSKMRKFLNKIHKVLATGTCLWGCQFWAFIPSEWVE